MKKLFFLPCLIFVSTSALLANPAQNKLDHAILQEYKENPKSDVTLLSVDKGLMVTNDKLKEYVPYTNNEFQPRETGFFGKIKKRLTDRMKSFVSGNDLLMAEKIEETKKLAETSDLVGQNIKKTLDLYRAGEPFKIVAHDICSASGPKLNAYYKNEVFSFTEVLDSKSLKTHTTQIKYKNALAKEKEDFVQVGSYRLAEYETYNYFIREGDKDFKLIDPQAPMTSIRMIDQFVNNQVVPKLDKNSQITKSEYASLKLELDKAWKLFKRAGACCAVDECKRALIGRLDPYTPAKSSTGSQSQPSTR